MAELLTNVAVADQYSTGATLGPALDIEQLVFQVFNEPVYAQFFVLQGGGGDSRMQPSLDPVEHYFPAGALVSVDQSGGVRFRNAIAGQPATINAEIGFAGDPVFDFQSSGLFSAAVLTLSFLHNNALVGAESTLDFEDSTAIVWTVTDTPGLKESVSAALTFGAVSSGTFVFSDPFSTGPTGSGFTHGLGVFVSGQTIWLTGSAFNTATLAFGQTGSANAWYFVRTDGAHFWGDGTNATDTTVSRIAAGVLQIGVTGQGGRWAAQNTAAGNLTFSSAVDGDTVSRWVVQAGGTLQWGPGGAGALDTSIGRNSTGRLIQSSPAQGARFDVQSFADADVVFSTFRQGESQVRWLVLGSGALQWGPGGASAVDITLARVVNAPTGTGSFLELTQGSGFGYGAGTGGVIASIVSGSSGTLNKPSGKFTGSAAIATGAFGTYTVSNTCVGADDLVIVNLVNGGGNIQRALVTAVAAGSFTVLYENASGVNQTPQINFAVIKGAQS